ncbi:MAG: hypothetical protein M0D57_21695 [Sphingobacteriales bacterium JAD_PAG50586_3]|nr:MAG: hypothetical protein M0D57_21695 [Sphingobacteriales bacterium JAD_PAG50586_3]
MAIQLYNKAYDKERISLERELTAEEASKLKFKSITEAVTVTFAIIIGLLVLLFFAFANVYEGIG